MARISNQQVGRKKLNLQLMRFLVTNTGFRQLLVVVGIQYGVSKKEEGSTTKAIIIGETQIMKAVATLTITCLRTTFSRPS